MLSEIIIISLKLIGSLALFMYGIQLASDGIQRAAGDRLQRTVNLMTRNTFSAVLTGIIITILIQSSSATTVMAISFVNAGLLTLIQSIGVIMGANIGTTLTGWIIAAVGIQSFSFAALAVPVFGLGFFMSILRKNNNVVSSYGESFMGFALVFLGLSFLSNAIPEPSGDALLFLQKVAGYGYLTIIACVIAGTLFTMVVHASSATVAIVIGMAAKNILTFEMAAAITLGANIGTTIVSFIISFRTNTNARRAAWTHILFNVFGSIWVVAVFKPFLRLVDWITPSAIGPETIGIHIAMLHTIFNTLNTIVLFPFVKQFAGLVTRMIKDKPSDLERAELCYVSGSFTQSPELNIVQARKDISDLAALALTMFTDFRKALTEPELDIKSAMDRASELERYADSMREGINGFLMRILGQDANVKTKENIGRFIRIVNDLESATDSCFNLMRLLERSYIKEIKLGKDKLDLLEPYCQTMDDFLSFIKLKVTTRITATEHQLATRYENSVDTMRNKLRKQARKRLKAGADVNSELLYIDMVRIIEQLGDFVYSVSGALRSIR